MNKYVKTIGKGFIAGIKHPIMEGFPTDVTKMDTGEAMLYGASMGFSQGLIQRGVCVVISVAVLIGIGYINSEINKSPVKVKMVVDK